MAGDAIGGFSKFAKAGKAIKTMGVVANTGLAAYNASGTLSSMYDYYIVQGNDVGPEALLYTASLYLDGKAISHGANNLNNLWSSSNSSTINLGSANPNKKVDIIENEILVDYIGDHNTRSEGFSLNGYNPKPGERTIEGYVRQNASPEISLYTNSAGFNNNENVGGEFKRFGAESHGGVSPHVHQPQRNVAPNGDVYGSVGRKTSNGGVTSPSAKDVKQLYKYLENGKYHK